MDAKKLSQYDIVKNALVGGAIGFFVSFFIPFLRPVKGMFLGALILVAIGVYKNLSNKSSAVSKVEQDSGADLDVPEELLKFDGLRKSGVITEEEFQARKARLLRR